MSNSKGKWIPGFKVIRPKFHKEFSCDCCEREFSQNSQFEKHLLSELHFKRNAKYQAERNHLLIENPPILIERRCRIVRNRNKCKENDSSLNNSTNSSSSIISTNSPCPSCLVNVNSSVIGKHLLSHFHLQKITGSIRQLNPEKTLILDNIHQIVLESPFQCQPCKFYFINKEQLLSHFTQKHLSSSDTNTTKDDKNPEIKLMEIQFSEIIGWSCSACQNQNHFALNGIGMLEHLKSDEHSKMEIAISKEIPIIIKQIYIKTCKLCLKHFLLNRAFLSHMKKKHPKLVSLNNLPIIDFGKQTSDLKIPFIIESKNTSFNCSECPKTFKSLTSLRKHVSHSHPKKESVLSCQQCNYIAKRKYHLDRHLKTHLGERERNFICKECQSTFFEKYALEYHKKIHRGKTVNCNYSGCKFTGRSLSELKIHKTSHSTERNFICDNNDNGCNYKAKTKAHLKRHKILKHKISDIL